MINLRMWAKWQVIKVPDQKRRKVQLRLRLNILQSCLTQICKARLCMIENYQYLSQHWQKNSVKIILKVVTQVFKKIRAQPKSLKLMLKNLTLLVQLIWWWQNILKANWTHCSRIQISSTWAEKSITHNLACPVLSKDLTKTTRACRKTTQWPTLKWISDQSVQARNQLMTFLKCLHSREKQEITVKRLLSKD